MVHYSHLAHSELKSARKASRPLHKGRRRLGVPCSHVAMRQSQPEQGHEVAGSRRFRNIMMAVSWRILVQLLLLPLGIAATFEESVRPFLAEHCSACHGERIQMAELRLDLFSDEAEALRHPGVWVDVLRMTRTGKMPPPGSPAPPSADLEALTAWIESRIGAMEKYRETRPGRVTARRLNRTEYNNTVRDLLGVNLSPANSFPVDDSGYGFDNIGDVLSTSPLLMEKYLDAAGKLARAAIWERPRLAEPTRFRIQASRDATNPDAIGSMSPFTLDGSIELSFDFPARGRYEFAFGATDRRQRSEDNGRYLPELKPPPRLMTLKIEGQRMATKAVEAAQYFDRTERVSNIMGPGEKTIWVGFIDFAGEPMNPNSEYSQRKLWVDYLEINGPYNAEAIPLPASHRRILTCRPRGEEPWRRCAEEILGRLALRAYRRPATEAEMDHLMDLAERSMRGGETFEGMAQTVLQAILVSPQFLFRIERDAVPGGSDEIRAIDDYELASRLSYFLWSSMPDDELLEVAGSGQLGSSKGIGEQVRRMLADPKATALVENFGGQWLQLRNLTHAKPDADQFPGFDETLRDSMIRETRLFFDSIVREDLSILTFLDGNHTFLNGRLARHYGITGIDGENFVRVELTDGRRGGLLGQASVLTVSSYPTRTSPVLRGLWVLENLLGEKPPPPPPDVPELEVRKGAMGGTLRQQLEEHRSNEGCMSCHLVMDAIGFGLENYDAVGRWRDVDGELPLDTSGSLPGGRKFESPAELRQILATTEASAFSRALTKKLLTYALGRGVDRTDNPAVDEIQQRLAREQHRFSALIKGIVNSTPFRMRASDVPEIPQNN